MIGKGITALVKTDTKITDRINAGNNLYPISDYGKGLDAIYYIIRMVPGAAKSTKTNQKWNVTLITHCKGYESSWELALLLERLFVKQAQQTHAGFKFIHIKCTNISDDYEFLLNNYGQQLQFEITTPCYTVEID